MSNIPSINEYKTLLNKYEDLEKKHKKMKMNMIIHIYDILNIPYVYYFTIDVNIQCMFIFLDFKKFNPTNEAINNLKKYFNTNTLFIEEDTAGMTVITWK